MKYKFTFLILAFCLALTTTVVPVQAEPQNTEATGTASGNTNVPSGNAPTDQYSVGVVDMGDDWPAPPVITAGSAILIDADTGTILYDKNSHVKGYPASVTKLMTALLTIENCSLSEIITFSRAAEQSVTWEDAKLGIKEGEQMTIEEAMYALLLKSANDVAFGLGEHIAGNIPAFAEMMNVRAAELGALNTHFNNASGLNDPNHYTTAYDIAMFSRTIMTNPTLTAMMQTRSHVIPPTNKYEQQRTVSQRHEMLLKGEHRYDYAIGGKTGFTDESKYTLCTFATKDEMNLIAVVLLCKDSDIRYVDTKALFEYGFNNFEHLTMSQADTSNLLNKTNYYSSSIFGGSSISFELASSTVTVPKGTTTENIQTVISREAAHGDVFATVQFQWDGHVIGNSEVLVSSTQYNYSAGKPSNLPYLVLEEVAPVTPKDYIVINAYHIIYGIIAVLFLLIILFGMIFMNYSEYGKEVMKTRKRRRSYRRRKLKF